MSKKYRQLHKRRRRKWTHELVGAPYQFHEDGAPELPPLPDEYNRNAPIVEPQKKDGSQMRKMVLLLAAGALTLGLLFPTIQTVLPSSESTPEEQTASVVTAAPTAAPNATDAPSAGSTEPTQTPSPSPTATSSPTPTPSPSPTPKPEVEGVELMYLYWVDGIHEEAEFTLSFRVPLKNIKKGLMDNEFEAYAWINSMRGADDWDGIWTLTDADVSIGEDENGDLVAYYSGPMYWADHPTPARNDLVTIAVAGVYTDGETFEESPLSNALTVGIGGKAYIEDTSNDVPPTQSP